MEFCFYPRHEYACPHVSHCPHLGGAALGRVVEVANGNGGSLDMLHGQLDAARESVSRLLAKTEALRTELEQVKLELRLERQNKFRTGCDTHDTDEAAIVEKRHGNQACDIYYRLLTQPPNQVLEYLYAGGNSKPRILPGPLNRRRTSPTGNVPLRAGAPTRSYLDEWPVRRT